MQKIITLVMTLLIFYAVIMNSVNSLKSPQNNANDKVKKTEKSEEFEGNFVDKAIAKAVHNLLKTDEGRVFVENLIKPMDQPIAAGDGIMEVNNANFINSLFEINDFGEGEGGRASCGHVVTISYRILNMENNVLSEGKETVTLGGGKIAPGLDAIVVGMKVGQTRHATIPTKYFTKNPEYTRSYFKLQVSLHKIIPHNFSDDAKIFDNQIAYKVPKLCGQKITYDAKITDLSNNKVLYDSSKKGQKIHMKIGDQNYPMIFSHALHNKTLSGSRTVLAKGKNFKSYVSDYSKIFPDKALDEDRIYMLELSNFSE